MISSLLIYLGYVASFSAVGMLHKHFPGSGKILLIINLIHFYKGGLK